jgi:hypothetical protein
MVPCVNVILCIIVGGYQMKNLVRDAQCKELIDKLDAALIAWSKSTGDPFPYDQALRSYSSYPGA